MSLNTAGAEHMFEIETSNSSAQNVLYDYNSAMHFQPDQYAATEGEATFMQLLPTFTEQDFENSDVVAESDFLHILLLYCESMSNLLSLICAHTYYNINANF